MKTLQNTNKAWLVIFLITDLTFIFILWVIKADSLKSISVFILLFSLTAAAAGVIIQRISARRISSAIAEFINDPDQKSKAALCSVCDKRLIPVINEAYESINGFKNTINDSEISLNSYREYIEAWTHEIKTPLSLMTLVLQNHQDEMSKYVYERTDYARLKILEQTENILYYARLQAKHPDVNFTHFELHECINDILEDFSCLAKEKNTEFIYEKTSVSVYSDKKIVSFIFSQLISNAVKYCNKQQGKIYIEAGRKTADGSDKISLSVRDNGGGVLPQDLPFIFDMGFTGSKGGASRATGMGLYLVKKLAEAVSVQVSVLPKDKNISGLGIELLFSVVD